MFNRLFVVLLLVAATVVVSTPARAETLTVRYLACESDGASFLCDASVSGGTGTYTSFVWGVAGARDSYYTTSEPSFSLRCVLGRSYSVSFRVTDSAGATAVATTGFVCR